MNWIEHEKATTSKAHYNPIERMCCLIATSHSPYGYAKCWCCEWERVETVAQANENTIAMDVLDYHKNVINRSKNNILKRKKKEKKGEKDQQPTTNIGLLGSSREALQSCLWLYILFLIHLIPSHTFNVYDFMCCFILLLLSVIWVLRPCTLSIFTFFVTYSQSYGSCFVFKVFFSPFRSFIAEPADDWIGGGPLKPKKSSLASPRFETANNASNKV